MEIKIINNQLNLNISGFSGIAVNKNYAGTAFALMDKMWPVIKSQGLKHKGLNIWVYGTNDEVFAGVELEDATVTGTGLQQKSILLTQYAYCKHIGPYSQLKQTGDTMRSEIQKRGFKSGLPYIEIYGHWTNDETKLETELLVAVEQVI